MDVRIIGDEIYYHGQLVAVLAQEKTPPSVMREFIFDFNNATLFEDVSCQSCNAVPVTAHTCDCPNYDPPEGCDPKEVKEHLEDMYDVALEDVQRSSKEYARGGLLKLSDLATICKQLAEEEPNETDVG